MKKVISLVLVILMLSALSITAFAAEPRVAGANPSLTFTGTTANCKVTIIEANKKITATMSLWQGDTFVDSWSGSGTSVVKITGSCEVEPGKTYTLKVSGTSGNTTLFVDPVSATCN